MNQELRAIAGHPALQQMMKYTFIGNKATVREKTEDFLTKTGVNEIMVVSYIYDHEDRVKSFRIFSELMQE